MSEIRIKIKTQFDPSKLFKEYEEAAEKAMEELMHAAYQEWQDEAGRRLHTTRRAYRDALQSKLISPGLFEIFLQHVDDKDNWLANALETGARPFNIREKVLATAKLHPERMAKMSPRQRAMMIKYLREHGRLGLPPTPYTDVPFIAGGVKEGKPSAFRRISKNQDTQSKWDHPGFQPEGTGGPGPLMPKVIEFIEEQAPEIFNRLFAKVSV